MHVDSLKLNNIVEKVSIYMKEYDIVSDEFNEIFNSISSLYKTDDGKASDLFIDCEKNIRKMEDNFQEYTFILNSTIQKYEKLIKEISHSFDDTVVGDIAYIKKEGSND